MAKKSIRSKWRLYHRRKKRQRKEEDKLRHQQLGLNTSQSVAKEPVKSLKVSEREKKIIKDLWGVFSQDYAEHKKDEIEQGE